MTSKKSKARVLIGDKVLPSTPINSAFAQLAQKFPELAPCDARPEVVPAASPAPTLTPDAKLAAALQRLRKPHVFKSKKGRGGKTVTEIEHLQQIEPSHLGLLCKQLCKRLGCGGSVEGDVVVLQGDHTAAVVAFFAAARL